MQGYLMFANGRLLVIDCRLRSQQSSQEISILPLRDSKPYSYLNAPYVNSCGELSAVGSIEPLSERRVFQNLFVAAYDVFPDGQRVIKSAIRPAIVHAPLTLVTDWTCANVVPE